MRNLKEEFVSAEFVIGIDIGSSRVKAIAYSSTGMELAYCALPTPTVRTGPYVDFPALEVLETALQALGEVSRHDGSLAAIGITSMGEVGTLLDEGRLLPLVFPSWHDDRGSNIIGDLVPLAASLDATERTGRHFRPVSTLAKLAWLNRQADGLRGTFLNLSGAVAWVLTGAPTQDGSLASTTGVFSPIERRMLSDLWEAAGLAEVALPPVREAGTSFPVSAEAAQKYRIPAGIPVVVAGHDHPVASVGTGALPGSLIDSIGTGEPLLAPLRKRRAGSEEPSLRGAPANISLETSPATGEPIAIYEGMRPGLAMEQFIALSGMTRDVLDAGVDPAISAGGITDEQVLALEHGEASIPLEVVTWSSLHAYFAQRAASAEQMLRGLTGASGPTVLTGGGLRSRAWVQMKADCGGDRLYVSTATETAARGAAAIAGAAGGVWRSPEAMPGAEVVPVREWLRADPKSKVTKR